MCPRNTRVPPHSTLTFSHRCHLPPFHSPFQPAHRLSTSSPPRTSSVYHQAQLNCSQRPYRTVFSRVDTHTIPSTVLDFGYTVQVVAVYTSTYRITAVGTLPYAVYGTVCSPKVTRCALFCIRLPLFPNCVGIANTGISILCAQCGEPTASVQLLGLNRLALHVACVSGCPSVLLVYAVFPSKAHCLSLPRKQN